MTVDNPGIFTDIRGMNGKEQLLALAAAYERATGLGTSTVSWRVFGDTKKLAAMRDHGAGIQLDRYEKAMRWFSENWPGNADWPESVTRPASMKEAV
ncbi:MAG: hypothetical protein ACJ8FU_08380 [Xanthobacteraceae bacterium]